MPTIGSKKIQMTNDDHQIVQAKLLAQVVKGKCFTAKELPDVPDAARKAPKVKKQKGLFDEVESDAE